jgi:8-amino-7-oxononanoate synthase
VRRYRHGDLDQLERLLRGSSPQPRVVCVDGVNSMTGNVPDLPSLAGLTRRYEALLYVDDAHGFGVLGERAADSPNRYGRRGNALVRHAGESYEGIVLTGGFSKAYSSLLAFVTCSPDLKRLIKAAGSPYAYSGPSPVASLASALLGLELNAQRGDQIRTRLAQLTGQVLDHLAAAGIWTSNTSGFPVIELPLADPDDLDAVGRRLFGRGVYVTLAPHPVVPRPEVGFRIQVTAANTEPEITHLLEVLDEVHRDFGLRSREAQPVTP